MPDRPLPVAVLDACVLVPMPLADTLLRLAEPPCLYTPKWTAEILGEVTRTLRLRFGKSAAKADYREWAMREFFPAALVTGHESLIGVMPNHPKDRHVLAAAVSCRASHLVTLNLKHFPERFARRGRVVGPSTFLKLLLDIDRPVVEQRLRDQAAAIGLDKQDLLTRLAASAPKFVPRLRGV